MTKLTVALVGQNFRPPARQVLTVLPLGTELMLLPEPDNEYDSNAVRVVVDMGEWPLMKLPLLNSALEGTSFDASEICAQGPLMLGYLARSGGKPSRGGPGNMEALALGCDRGNLTTFADGSPAVEINNAERTA